MRKKSIYDDGRRLWEIAVPSVRPARRSGKEKTGARKAPDRILDLCARVLRKYTEGDEVELEVEFYPYVGLKNSVRYRGKRLLLRFSDLMADAPREAIEATAHLLFARIHHRRCPKAQLERYQAFTRSDAIDKAAHASRLIRRRDPSPESRGRVRDLTESFDRVNRRYFNGSLTRPVLTWSPNHARRHLAHHDPQINRIVVSRVFDDAKVPLYVLDYILFHESLHTVIPTTRNNGRRVVHSAEFRRAEKRYDKLREAVRWLKENL